MSEQPCPCAECEHLAADDDERDIIVLPPTVSRSVGRVSPHAREQLIAEMGASLVELRELIRRTGGYMKAEDQATLRHVDDVIAAAKVTP